MSRRMRDVALVRSQTYEITLAGQAGAAVRAEFHDCEITVGPRTTTLRAELTDRPALAGLVLRITGLRLDLIQLRRLTPPIEGTLNEGADSPSSGLLPRYCRPTSGTWPWRWAESRRRPTWRTSTSWTRTSSPTCPVPQQVW